MASYVKVSYFGELFLRKSKGEGKTITMNFASLQFELLPNT